MAAGRPWAPLPAAYKGLAQARPINAPWLFAAWRAVDTARSIKEMEMNNLHPAFAAALAPFAPPDAFTEAQLLEADRYLAGPARDPQFFNRRTELYEQRRQREAERLELQHHQEVV